MAPPAPAHRITAVARLPFKFSARTRVGFSDTDAQGVVYYGRYNPYFDLARVEYLRSLGLLHRDADGQYVMRANDVEYFAPARFDDEIEVYARVSRIGRTSVTYAFAAYKIPEDTLMVTAHQTLVYIHGDDRTPLPVPETFRDAVSAFEGADVEH
jgi:acyl-CoA thioester hydrolase